jgi:hypothetical protein
MAYCHALAVAGGKRLTQRWGGSSVVMDTADGELTSAMVSHPLS